MTNLKPRRRARTVCKSCGAESATAVGTKRAVTGLCVPCYSKEYRAARAAHESLAQEKCHDALLAALRNGSFETSKAPATPKQVPPDWPLAQAFPYRKHELYAYNQAEPAVPPARKVANSKVVRAQAEADANSTLHQRTAPYLPATVPAVLSFKEIEDLALVPPREDLGDTKRARLGAWSAQRNTGTSTLRNEYLQGQIVEAKRRGWRA